MDQEKFFDQLTISLDAALQSPTAVARKQALRLAGGAALVALLAGKTATNVAETSAKGKSKKGKKKKARNERLRARSIGHVATNEVRTVAESEPGNPGDQCGPAGCANNLDCTSGGSNTCYIPPDQTQNFCSSNPGKPCGVNGTGTCSGGSCSGGGGDDGWCAANGGACKCGCNEAANCCNECVVCPDHCECGCNPGSTTCKTNCGGGCNPNPHVCVDTCGSKFDGCKTVDCGECPPPPPTSFCESEAGLKCPCGCDCNVGACIPCPPPGNDCRAGYKFDFTKGRCVRGRHCDCPNGQLSCISAACPDGSAGRACSWYPYDKHSGHDNLLCVQSVKKGKGKKRGNKHGNKRR